MPWVRIALLLQVLFLLSCGVDRPPLQEGAWTDLPNEHARHFQIAERGSVLRVIVLGTGGVSDTLSVLYIGPSERTATDNEANGSRPAFQRVAVVSTTHLPFIDALERSSTVVGAAHLAQVIDGSMLKRLPADLVDIGMASGLDRERLVQLAPEALFNYTFGQRSDAAINIPGMVHVPVTEYMEEHPLGRAEWLRFFGAVLGRKAAGDSLYAAIRDRYHAASAMVDGAERPLVFFGSAWQGNWFVPPGNSYMATLISDAGGRYIHASRTASENLPMDLESVLDQASQAAHFGAVLAIPHEAHAMDLAHGDARIAALPALRSGGFVGNSHSSDLFGRAVMEPDVILQDLRCIFHASACAGHVPVYFRPVAQ